MVGTPRGVAYVPMVSTYGAPVPTLPSVLMVSTPCAHGEHGILFFPAASARCVDELFPVPLLEVAGRQMCAVSQIGEAVVRADPASVHAEKTEGGHTQEAMVLQLLIPTHNRARGLGADCFRRVAAGQEHLAVIYAVVAQPSSQLDPQQPGSRRHGAPGRCRHDCLGDRHKRPVALSFALHAVLLALARRSALWAADRYRTRVGTCRTCL